MLFDFADIADVVEFLAAVPDGILCLSDFGLDGHLAEGEADSRAGKHLGAFEHFPAHLHGVGVDRDGLEAINDRLIAEFSEIISGRIGLQIGVINHCGYFFYADIHVFLHVEALCAETAR